jgi:hypothetical protein
MACEEEEVTLLREPWWGTTVWGPMGCEGGVPWGVSQGGLPAAALAVVDALEPSGEFGSRPSEHVHLPGQFSVDVAAGPDLDLVVGGAAPFQEAVRVVVPVERWGAVGCEGEGEAKERWGVRVMARVSASAEVGCRGVRGRGRGVVCLREQAAVIVPKVEDRHAHEGEVEVDEDLELAHHKVLALREHRVGVDVARRERRVLLRVADPASIARVELSATRARASGNVSHCCVTTCAVRVRVRVVRVASCMCAVAGGRCACAQ